MTLILKRNKTAENFQISKLRNSLEKIFNTTNSTLTDEIFREIELRLTLKDGMTTSELQVTVEDILMRLGYFEQARFFIIYKHINHYSKSLSDRVDFMRRYLTASNAASGSKFDSNANVTEKNIATLNNELYKGDIIKLNRHRLYNKIKELYSKDLADEYLRQLERHELYKHDESSVFPYCVSCSLYPYLLNGLESLGGLSAKPKNLDSFCGTFVNLLFAISSQFAGAVSTGEFLMYFDYFTRKEFGEDYYQRSNEIYKLGKDLRALLRKTNIPFKNFLTINDLKNFDFGDDNELRDKIVKESTRLADQDELKSWYESCMDKDGNFHYQELVVNDGTRTIKSQLEQYFQQIVYTMNQPAASRGYQSTFWNIAYFDKYYFQGLFEEFRFPDLSKPNYESLEWLQELFMNWFNNERTKTILTFPVESFSLMTDKDTKEFKDEKAFNLVSEMYSKGHSFFTYISDNPDALSSCCRLRNELNDNTFSFSLGMGGVMTGSKSVMTLNINRLVQDAVRKGLNYVEYLREQVRKVHKYQRAFNELIKEFYDLDALPVYKAGFITMDRQYLTIGVNGFVEAAEFLGIPVNVNEAYKNFCDSILKVFYEENKKDRTKELRMNTEFVPAENLGVKFYKWDKEDGYVVPESRVCYNSYFYAVEDNTLSVLDKIKLHGKDFTQYLDGGSALHINLEDHLTKDQYKLLLKKAAVEGTNYLTFNIPNTVCKDCKHIDKRYLKVCPKCGSSNIDWATRIIGYLKLIGNYADPRKKEASIRFYSKWLNTGIVK